jgi:hypothetical protein
MLDKNDFTLFNENEFNNIIGDPLSVILEDRGINGYPEYFITYTSLQIANHIREYTSLNIYKEYNQEYSDDYDAYLALARHEEDGEYKYTFGIKLKPEQIEAIKLACIYQADYIIDNGSTERMTAMGMVNRSNKYNKADLHEFEICSMSHMLLANAGLLYQGLGGGLYAKIK